MSGLRNLNGSLQDELIIPILPSLDALRTNQTFFQYYYSKTVTRVFYVEAYYDPQFDPSIAPSGVFGSGEGGVFGTGTGGVFGTGVGGTPIGVGAGFWEWDPTDTTSPDNGLTCVVDLLGHRYKLQGFGLLGLVNLGWVPNIATLRALPAPPGPMPVMVLGYYEPGDKPPVTYVWSTTDARPDDGGGVIIPNGYLGLGRWILP